MCASREGRGKPSRGRSRHPCPRVAPMRVTRHAWPRARVYFRVATSAHLFSRGRMAPGCQVPGRPAPGCQPLLQTVRVCNTRAHGEDSKPLGCNALLSCFIIPSRIPRRHGTARSSARHAPTRSAGVYTHTPTCHAPTRHACVPARIMRGREQPMSPAHPRAPPKKSYIGDCTGLNPFNRSSPN